MGASPMFCIKSLYLEYSHYSEETMLRICVVLSVCVLFAGCSGGQSRQMTPAQTYPTFIMSLYDDVKPHPSTPPTAPMRVAVGQVGELVPPQAMLDHLSQSRAKRKRVQICPSIDGRRLIVTRRARSNSNPMLVSQERWKRYCKWTAPPELVKRTLRR